MVKKKQNYALDQLLNIAVGYVDHSDLSPHHSIMKKKEKTQPIPNTIAKSSHPPSFLTHKPQCKVVIPKMSNFSTISTKLPSRGTVVHQATRSTNTSSQLKRRVLLLFLRKAPALRLSSPFLKTLVDFSLFPSLYLKRILE